MHGLCVLLCEVLNAGGSAVLCFGRLVGGDACGIVCRVLACESVAWLVSCVSRAGVLLRWARAVRAALRRRGVGPPHFCPRGLFSEKYRMYHRERSSGHWIFF